MSNAKDIGTDNLKLNVLLYGKSGTGKTTFACSFPKPYVFDFDKGMLSQKGRDVDFDTYTSYNDFEFKLKELEVNNPYETLIVDSITTLQEYLMQKLLALSRRSMPSLHEYNVLITNLVDLFMRLTKASNHLIVIAHELVMQDELTSEITIRPLVIGKKLPAQLPLWFDEVYRTQVSRTKEGVPVYDILTRSDLKYMAKSRLSCLDTVETWSKEGQRINPYELIMNKIKNS